IRVSYLPQIDIFDEQLSIRDIILEHFPDHLQDWEIQKQLNDIQEQMQFSDLDRIAGTLSGGWKKRVALACILAQDNDLVLLDEPTNHLDLQGILWLEAFLQSARFAFIIISHDRFILENTCNRIMDLDRRYKQGYLKVRGNYSQFLQDQEKYLSDQRMEEEALSNKVRREIDWLRHGPKARTTKAQYRIDKAHGMIDDLTELKQRNNLQTEAGLKFEAGDRRSKKLLHARGISKTRGGQLLFKDLELFLSPRMKIGIMGVNGSGKSSLIDILRGKLDTDFGEVEIAQGVNLVTLDQSRHLPDENVSLKRALAPDGDTVIFHGSPLHISAWAKKFLFQKEQLELPVSQLSGGERARVLLAKIMLETAEILILDEPTNDLDIPTLEVLEESLLEFTGALLLITHDRYLMDQVCDEIIYLAGDGTVKVFADTYQLTNFQKSIETIPEQTEIPSPSNNKLRHQQLKTLRKAFDKTERDIDKAELQKAELEAALHNPDNASNPAKLTELSETIEKLDDELESLLENWESLAEAISKLEG
ncbi:MAG: ABC-F family ATP-binding cassette domain-containing protein, partial [Candidatus Marinimicrobia bacterium]|nr:ABC-F family ATP-binding cassette domain-containing protein [Candidatus Neomarinimicrobiota bacterium]MBT4713794.1 ABC-F family ATP-binding cassette domain-containing protein [Candidatus Neomarinimicrobiota bacterium]MBT4945440.1 ABC-F family ATP-binding cassette domain-containing protein [Candidatus Neomarinimicrobiota bacterium]MBT5267922.1 ABC-F family ATP-binding cassette domain-containing protein [Candidatus Neomarinimicrobiota bacterium]MBT6010458.1 ABC-F family ATP-binding cassette do